MPMSGFTDRVRQELARVEVDERRERVGELAGLLFLGGSLHLRSGQVELELATTSGAVARRGFTWVRRELDGANPELQVHAPGGLRDGSRYLVVVRERAEELARITGLVDGRRRPRRVPPPDLLAAGRTRTGFARGAAMAAGSVSAPGRDPHLEIGAASAELAEVVAEAFAHVGSSRPTVSSSGRRHRVVLKSGGAIGSVLAGLGASRAFLEWDDARLRRHLRGEANRLANADAANVRRAVAAASAQVRSVERVIERRGWGALDDELREIALVRLANPEATLAELGELCDPAVSKSSVHRRLQRIDAIGSGPDVDAPDGDA